MNEAEVKKLFDEYFPVSNGDKTKPYLILFDAYIGYGKSYIAKRIAELDSSVVVCNNEVRCLFNDYGDDNDQLWRPLVEQRLKDLLAAGNSVIVDECLPINYERKLEKYRSLGYPIYVIRINIDEDTLRERLKARQFNPPEQYSVINYNDAMRIRANNGSKRLPDELINFTIDASKPVEPQVKNFVNEILD